MKQLFTLAFIIIFFQVSNAQVWVELGAKGGGGLSLLMNKNIFDDSSYNHQFSSGTGFGGHLGVNIGQSHGFVFDVMSHSMSQRFEYKLGSSGIAFHENTINWKNLDLYLLYRYNNNRVYLELGPMLSLVRSVEQDDAGLALVEINIDDVYADKYYSAVFGFGGYLLGNETFSLNFGARIHYAMQDFVSEDGRISNSSSGIKDFPAPIRDETYAEYKQTRPLFVELSLEFTFGIGEFAKESCSDRMHWFWSGNR